MSAKSKRNKENKKAESRLLDQDPIEQRALQIARDEGRGEISEMDRLRAREELLAPNETIREPELTPGMPEITEWDEVPGSSGTRTARVLPEDEASVGKELVEKGFRGPDRTRNGEDPLLRSEESES